MNKQKRNSCGGCLIIFVALVLFWGAILSMCSESPEKVKARQDSEVNSFLAEKNLALDLKAAGTMTQKEFRCYAERSRVVIDPAVSERRAALDAGTISLEQLKSELDLIYMKKGEQIFLECSFETK